MTSINAIPDELLWTLCEFVPHAGYLSMTSKTFRKIPKRHAQARSISKLSEILSYQGFSPGSGFWRPVWGSMMLDILSRILLYEWASGDPECIPGARDDPNARAFAGTLTLMRAPSEKRRICVQGTISTKYCLWPYRIPYERLLRIRKLHPNVYALL